MRCRLIPVLFMCFGAGLFQARALDPNQPPGGNFDLTHWKLTLPIGSAGSPTEESPSQLAGGFTNANFYTAADGSMTFWCPVNGVTTSGSGYPRSELREEINGLADDDATWTIGQFAVSELTATLKVQQYPNDQSQQRVIIGQIHAPGFPFIKLNYEHDKGYGMIVAQVNQNSTTTDTESDYTIPTGVSDLTTNTVFSYDIRTVVSNSTATLYISVNGNTPTGIVETAWISGANNGLYFKAGDYCQESGTSSTLGSQVAFYAVAVSHGAGGPTAPSITTPPTNQTVTVGQNATFTVTAAGTAPLAYQWRFNTNTILVGATNTSLTITNSQTTNAGNYTVVVTNSSGSVTSAVATLTVNLPVAPAITNQPQSLTVTVGQSAAFTVVATGATPLVYQWYFNTNTALAGATNATLAINPVQTNNAGAYTVVVTNSLGAVTSNVARLTVNLATNQGGVLLDDRWLDGTRTNTSLPTDAAWYASSSSALAVATNVLTATATSGSPTWWTYFTTNSASPVQLGVGDTLKVTAAFTLAGVNTNNSSRSLRLGLFDSSGNTRSLADGSVPNGTNVTGYMLNMNMGQTFGASSPFQLMQRTDPTSSSLISSSSPFTVLNSGGPASGAAGFSNGMPYTLVVSVVRDTNQVRVLTQFTDTNGGSFSLTATNSTVTNLAASFDTFVMRSSAVAQTATNFIFSEFKVEVILAAAPAPQFTNCGIDANGRFTAQLLGAAGRSYVIQASTDLSSWVPVVTNSSPGGSFSFTDTNAPGFARRFYRAFAP